MKEKAGFKTLAWVAVILIGCNILLTWDVNRNLHGVIKFMSIRKTSIVSSWPSKGINLAVTTHLGEFGEGETDPEHAERHRTALIAMMEIFPLTGD